MVKIGLKKCSDRSIWVEIPVHLGNYDRQTDRPTDCPTDRPDYREVTRHITTFHYKWTFWRIFTTWIFFFVLILNSSGQMLPIVSVIQLYLFITLYHITNHIIYHNIMLLFAIKKKITRNSPLLHKCVCVCFILFCFSAQPNFRRQVLTFIYL